MPQTPEGMNAAGFESKEYWGFVVSDLGRDTTMQVANELAPPLKAALDAGSGSEARADLDAAPLRVKPAASRGHLPSLSHPSCHPILPLI